MFRWVNDTGDSYLYERLFTFQSTKLHKYLSHRIHNVNLSKQLCN